MTLAYKLEQNSTTPLYEQLKEAIKADVDNNIYKYGDKLPSETELEEMYSVSRITVRRAVKELCDAGVLVKKQGKGTFVAGFNSLDYDGIGFNEAMEGIGKKPMVKILEKTYGDMPLHLARVLGLDVKQKIIVFKMLMIADGDAISVDRFYIPAEEFEKRSNNLKDDTAALSLFKSEMNTNYYRKIVGVTKATKEIASLLNCPEDSPVFEFFRIAYSENGDPIMLTTSHISGENKYYILEDSKCDSRKTKLIWG